MLDHWWESGEKFGVDFLFFSVGVRGSVGLCDVRETIFGGCFAFFLLLEACF